MLGVLACLGAIPLGVVGCASGTPILVDGETRVYRLHVPGDLGGDAPVPLVLALHQFSDTAQGMAYMTEFDALADREGFIVAYPQGRWRVWDAGAGSADVVFLDVLLDELEAAYPIDPKRIYATGASAGAQMIQAYAAQRGRLAAIAPVMGPVSPGQLESWKRETPLPVLLIHGKADPVVPYGEAGETVDAGSHGAFVSAPDLADWWAVENGCALPAVVETLPGTAAEAGAAVRVSRYACGAAAEVLLYTIEGGGHTWPGGRNRYPRFIVGNLSNQLNATQVIWDFFQGHSLD